MTKNTAPLPFEYIKDSKFDGFVKKDHLDGLKKISLDEIKMDDKGEKASSDFITASAPKSTTFAFHWNKKDREEISWIPQGISYTTDSEGTKILVVSWCQKNLIKKTVSSRLSFINTKTYEYKHVLLIEAAGLLDLKIDRTGMHAGGVAVVGQTVYVADPEIGGLRIFDLGHIYKLDFNFTSIAALEGYSYVMPTLGYYKLNSLSGADLYTQIKGTPSLSFVSVDRSTTPNRLITGDYVHANISSNNPPVLCAWSLSSSSNQTITDRTSIYELNLPIANGGLASPLLDLPYIQGGAMMGSNMLLNRSNDKAINYFDGLVIGAGEFSNQYTETWPISAQDISYDQTNNELWSLTSASERPDGTGSKASKEGGYRFVFCVNLSSCLG